MKKSERRRVGGEECDKNGGKRVAEDEWKEKNELSMEAE